MSVAQDEPSTPEGAAPPWARSGARPLVRFEGVRKRYGEVAAVDGVTLDIFERELFALLGPSGCGKTKRRDDVSCAARTPSKWSN